MVNTQLVLTRSFIFANQGSTDRIENRCCRLPELTMQFELPRPEFFSLGAEVVLCLSRLRLTGQGINDLNLFVQIAALDVARWCCANRTRRRDIRHNGLIPNWQ